MFKIYEENKSSGTSSANNKTDQKNNAKNKKDKKKNALIEKSNIQTKVVDSTCMHASSNKNASKSKNRKIIHSITTSVSGIIDSGNIFKSSTTTDRCHKAKTSHYKTLEFKNTEKECVDEKLDSELDDFWMINGPDQKSPPELWSEMNPIDDAIIEKALGGDDPDATLKNEFENLNSSWDNEEHVIDHKIEVEPMQEDPLQIELLMPKFVDNGVFDE